jgi:hypothetical protein
LNSLGLDDFLQVLTVGVICVVYIEVLMRLVLGRDVATLDNSTIRFLPWRDLFRRRLGEAPFVRSDTSSASARLAPWFLSLSLVLGIFAQGMAHRIDYTGQAITPVGVPEAETQAEVFFATSGEIASAELPHFSKRYDYLVRSGAAIDQPWVTGLREFCSGKQRKNCRDIASSMFYLVKGRVYGNSSWNAELIPYDNLIGLLRAITLVGYPFCFLIADQLMLLMFAQIFMASGWWWCRKVEHDAGGRARGSWDGWERYWLPWLISMMFVGAIGYGSWLWILGESAEASEHHMAGQTVLVTVVLGAFSWASGAKADSISYLRTFRLSALLSLLVAVPIFADMAASLTEKERTLRVYGYGIDVLQADVLSHRERRAINPNVGTATQKSLAKIGPNFSRISETSETRQLPPTDSQLSPELDGAPLEFRFQRGEIGASPEEPWASPVAIERSMRSWERANGSYWTESLSPSYKLDSDDTSSSEQPQNWRFALMVAGLIVPLFAAGLMNARFRGHHHRRLLLEAVEHAADSAGWVLQGKFGEPLNTEQKVSFYVGKGRLLVVRLSSSTYRTSTGSEDSFQLLSVSLDDQDIVPEMKFPSIAGESAWGLRRAKISGLIRSIVDSHLAPPSPASANSLQLRATNT